MLNCVDSSVILSSLLLFISLVGCFKGQSNVGGGKWIINPNIKNALSDGDQTLEVAIST